jgi:predicted membrane-bound spermidine synthase
MVIIILTTRLFLAKHPGVEEIIECEIDEGVINVSKKYLPSLAKGYDDPRVAVKIMDGAKFMEENQEAFDVIITDSSDRKSILFKIIVLKPILSISAVSLTDLLSQLLALLLFCLKLHFTMPCKFVAAS